MGGSYAVIISSCERDGLTPLLLVDLVWSYMHLLLVKCYAINLCGWCCTCISSLGGQAYIITIGSRGRGLFF